MLAFNCSGLKDLFICLADASNAIFRKAKLAGSRFYRANLKEADFSGADLSSASLEDTSLVDVLFTNANLNVSTVLKSN